jgi:hypothetical protein
MQNLSTGRWALARHADGCPKFPQSIQVHAGRTRRLLGCALILVCSAGVLLAAIPRPVSGAL